VSIRINDNRKKWRNWPIIIDCQWPWNDEENDYSINEMTIINDKWSWSNEEILMIQWQCEEININQCASMTINRNDNDINVISNEMIIKYEEES